MAQPQRSPIDRYSSLELRHLRLVYAVAEGRGLTAASHRLNLTPSALSHRLRQVESIVGMPLFRRERKSMHLTAAGEIVFELSVRAMSAIADVEERLLKLREGVSGTIRLCTHCYTGYHWLPAVMTSFRAVRPGTDIRVVAEATNRALDALVARELDLVITTLNPADRRFRSRVAMRDEILLLVPASHPLARRKYVEPAHFASEHLLLYATSPEDSIFCREFLRPAGVWPRRFTSVLLTEAIVEMVKAGIGITCMAEWAAQPALAGGALVAVRLGRNGFKRAWRAVSWNDPEGNPLVDEFVDHLIRCFSSGKPRKRLTSVGTLKSAAAR